MIFRTTTFVVIVILVTGFLPLKENQSFGERRRWKRRSSKTAVKKVDTTYLDSLNRGKEVSLINDNLDLLTVNKKNEIPEGKKIIENGYRIQLASSNSVENLRTEKKSAEAELKIQTYIIFEKPYYKIFAGDFITRKDAEKAITKIKESGYPDAWIVKSDIFVSN